MVNEHEREAKGQNHDWSGKLTHGALGEVVAPTVHGCDDVVPVSGDVEVAIAIGQEDGERQVLDGRVVPY